MSVRYAYYDVLVEQVPRFVLFWLLRCRNWLRCCGFFHFVCFIRRSTLYVACTVQLASGLVGLIVQFANFPQLSNFWTQLANWHDEDTCGAFALCFPSKRVETILPACLIFAYILCLCSSSHCFRLIMFHVVSGWETLMSNFLCPISVCVFLVDLI